MLRCADHDLPGCVHSQCRTDRDRRTTMPTLSEAIVAALTDPAHPLHQSVYRRGLRAV